MANKKHLISYILLALCVLTISLVFLLQHQKSDAVFAGSISQATRIPFPWNGEEQEMIKKYESILSRDDLDPILRKSIEGKLLMLERIVAARENSAAGGQLAMPAGIEEPQVQTDPTIQSGIFEGDEGIFRPEEAVIQNYWQGVVEGQIVQVFAGSAGSDPEVGVIFVMVTSADRMKTNIERYEAPPGTGSLHIISESAFMLTLAGKDNTQIFFDIFSRQFTDS
jgi:hypothetical protein